LRGARGAIPGRSAFVIGCLVGSLVGGAVALSSDRNKALVDFEDPGNVRLFRPIDDVVMGGRSSSRLEAGPAGVARFVGHVSLENNGGFASVRSAPRDWQLAGAMAFALRVRGDGRTYKFTLRVDDGFDGLQYQARFTATPVWTEIRLPLASFAASFRGRLVPEAPPLDPARIRTIGLMLSDRQDGDFELLIASIEAEFD
jgi:NADH dehydrogenase [ubiquinone] 1 alpha subcomplex assembly factor 1